MILVLVICFFTSLPRAVAMKVGSRVFEAPHGPTSSQGASRKAHRQHRAALMNERTVTPSSPLTFSQDAKNDNHDDAGFGLTSEKLHGSLRAGQKSPEISGLACAAGRHEFVSKLLGLP